MKKSIIIILSFISLVSLTTISFAKTVTTGIVNVQQVIGSIPEAKQIPAQVDKQLAPQRKQLDQAQKELQAMLNDYQKNMKKMSKKKRKTVNDKMDKYRDKIMAMAQYYRQEVVSAQHQAMGKILARMKAAVAVVAKQKQLTQVFLDSIMLYHGSNTIDITPDVIKALKTVKS